MLLTLLQLFLQSQDHPLLFPTLRLTTLLLLQNLLLLALQFLLLLPVETLFVRVQFLQVLLLTLDGMTSLGQLLVQLGQLLRLHQLLSVRLVLETLFPLPLSLLRLGLALLHLRLELHDLFVALIEPDQVLVLLPLQLLRLHRALLDLAHQGLVAPTHLVRLVLQFRLLPA